MSGSFLSTNSLTSSPRASVLRLQSELARVQSEIASGRPSDYGLEFGGGMRELAALKQTQTWQDALRSTGALAAVRQDTGQTALENVAATAQDLLSQLITARDSPVAARSLPSSARSALVSSTGQLNVQLGGVHLFAGDNSAVKPLNDYHAAGGAARQQVAGDFLAAFGVAADDPSVASITSMQMQAFLDTTFAAAFADPNWETNWSEASTEPMQLEISEGQTVEIGASANEAPIRQLLQAYVMVSDLGMDKLEPSTRQIVVERATQLLGEAIGGLTQMRSRLGSVQQRIDTTGDNLEGMGVIITNRLNQLEQVDLYEASTAASTLLTQLQASYAITARLQQMSILNYL